jgi:hypothetical protein
MATGVDKSVMRWSTSPITTCQINIIRGLGLNSHLLALALPRFFFLAIMAYKHQYLLCLKAAQRATGIGCIEYLPTTQDKIGGLKVTVLAIKICTDLLGFFPNIQPVNDWKFDLMIFNHFPSIFFLIDRQRDNADVCVSELFLVFTEVCELQITECSPMSSVE